MSFALTRQVFEELSTELFQRTTALVGDAIAASDIDRSEIDGVVLIGGSTHIPKLVQSLADSVGIQPTRDVDADEAVACGAAVHGRALFFKDATGGEEPHIDSVPHTIWAEVREASLDSLSSARSPGSPSPSVMAASKIFARDAVLPTTKVSKVYVSRDQERCAVVRVFEGESAAMEENDLLGVWKFCNKDSRHGLSTTEIYVDFELTGEGILHVRARRDKHQEDTTHTAGEKHPRRLADAEIGRMRRDSAERALGFDA